MLDNTPRALVEARLRSPPRPNPKNLFGRIVAAKAVIHIADFSAEEQEHFEPGNPDQIAGVELGGVKTLLIVPLRSPGGRKHNPEAGTDGEAR